MFIKCFAMSFIYTQICRLTSLQTVIQEEIKKTNILFVLMNT